MAVFDAEDLLREISAEQPGGDDLEYDPAFSELTRIAQRRPEQQFGDTIIPAEEPDWRAVEKAAIALFGRTKDLRVGVQLAMAAIRTSGYDGFESALAVMRGLVERYWDSVHPMLDPEDDNDPTARVNVIVSLADRGACLTALRETPIVESRAVGRFSLRDIEAAAAHAGADEPPPGIVGVSTIDAAFLDAPLDGLKQRLEEIRAAIGHVKAIERAVTDQVGVGNAPNLEDLVRALNDASRVLSERTARREGAQAPVAEAGADVAVAIPAAGGAGPGVAGPGVSAAPGRISSRADVIKALDRICDYYLQAEPASPVPILLDRARRLVDKNFIELLEDLVPAGADQFQVFRGNVG
jgi:type VI secretion system protein ImpA